MITSIDSTNPAIQREAQANINEALLSSGIDIESPVRTDLLKRVRVLSGYRDAVIRFSDNDRTLVPAEVCLDQLLNTPAGTANSSTGPLKIRMSDKQALYVASEEIALGKVVVIDDRVAR